jgi:hypothetical protein
MEFGLMNSDDQPSFTPAIWTDVHRVMEENCVALVRKSDHVSPRYSIEVLFVKPTGDLGRYHPVRWRKQNNVVSLEQRISDMIAFVVDQAEDYIELEIRKDRELLEAKRSA